MERASIENLVDVTAAALARGQTDPPAGAESGNLSPGDKKRTLSRDRPPLDDDGAILLPDRFTAASSPRAFAGNPPIRVNPAGRGARAPRTPDSAGAS